MSCLSWNCRGLGNPQTEDELVTLIGNKAPKLVFLMETKVDRYVIEKIRRKVQFADCHVVPRQNRGGGLALLWTDTITVDVLSSSECHIDVVIDQGMDDAWRLTGFYGNPDTANREDSWSLLKT